MRGGGRNGEKGRMGEKVWKGIAALQQATFFISLHFERRDKAFLP